MTSLSTYQKALSNPELNKQLISFHRSLVDLFDAMEDCIKNKHLTATLVLIYSTIDALSWMEHPNKKGIEGFPEWVEKWLLPNDEILCTGIDLYAARSGILHRLSTKSELALKGRAKEISYCHGNVDFNILISVQENVKDKKDLGCVKVESLIKVLKEASDQFIEHMAKNETDRFEEILREHPVRIDT